MYTTAGKVSGGPENAIHERIQVRAGERIPLEEVLDRLRDRGHTFDTYMFLYYSRRQSMHIYCGCSGELSGAFVSRSDISEVLRLRCRKAKQNAAGEVDSVASEESGRIGRNKEGRKGKRTKERKIGEVISKVSEWRRLYSGVRGSEGGMVKYSLEEAAMKVGIAKKTLDDYLLQLRFGKKYGFDFNMYKDEKVGVLRSFVKEQKAKERGLDKADESKSGGDDNTVSKGD